MAMPSSPQSLACCICAHSYAAVLKLPMVGEATRGGTRGGAGGHRGTVRQRLEPAQRPAGNGASPPPRPETSRHDLQVHTCSPSS